MGHSQGRRQTRATTARNIELPPPDDNMIINTWGRDVVSRRWRLLPNAFLRVRARVPGMCAGVHSRGGRLGGTDTAVRTEQPPTVKSFSQTAMWIPAVSIVHTLLLLVRWILSAA